MKDESFSQFVLDQLDALGEAHCRHMFGGYGVYHEDTFFGIISDGRLYFKTNPETRERYVEQGMKPFRPSKKLTLKNYYEVPADILEEPDTLTDWAREAVETQRSGKAGKPKKRKRKTSR